MAVTAQRATVARALGSVLLVAVGAAVLVLSLLPSHPRTVTATVATVAADQGTISVTTAEAAEPMTVRVADPAEYAVGSAVVVTLRGSGPGSATIGDTRDPLVNVWSGVCAFAAGVLFGLPLVRARASSAT